MDDDKPAGSGMAKQGMAVVLVILALLSLVFLPLLIILLAASSQEDVGGVDNVPAEYREDVLKAGGVCQAITPPVIAAQIEAESGWNPRAGSGAGAQGIAQFMPATWASVGLDGDGDGRADVWNAHDAIWTQGHYMCNLVSQVESAKKSGRVQGDTLQLALAAYNAGMGSVLSSGGIPQYSETQAYIKRIMGLIPKYTPKSGSGQAGTAGSLQPPLRMQADGRHVDVAAMGISFTYYGGPSGYAPRQCTWWAAVRRASISRPVDSHMGNGGFWGDSARRLGYQYGKDPRLGAAMSIAPGVLGSDGYCGHVAIVEQINQDGSIVVSESGAKMPAPALRSLSAAQLQANAAGITYIY